MHFFIVWVLWGRLKVQTIRAKNHILPGEPYFATFTIRIIIVLKQILVNCLNPLCQNLFVFHLHKERNLFLWKIKKIQEIKNKWRNMVTWRNMVQIALHSCTHQHCIISYWTVLLYATTSWSVPISLSESSRCQHLDTKVTDESLQLCSMECTRITKVQDHSQCLFHL